MNLLDNINSTILFIQDNWFSIFIVAVIFIAYYLYKNQSKLNNFFSFSSPRGTPILDNFSRDLNNANVSNVGLPLAGKVIVKP